MLIDFIPKILIMFSIISFIRYDQLYNCPEKETIIECYYRYIEGQFGVDFSELENFKLEPDS